MLSYTRLNLFVFILFTIFISIGIPEISFLLALFSSILIFLNRGISFIHLKVIVIPIFIVIIGLINSYKNPTSLLIKDLYYFLFPIVVFTYGFYYGKYFDIRTFLKHIVFISLLLSFIYLFKYIYSFNYVSNVGELKDVVGNPSFLIVVSFFCLVNAFRNKKLLFLKKFSRILSFLFFLVIILSQSRTFIILTLVFFLFGSGYLRFNKFFLKRSIIILISMASFLYLISLQNIDDRKTLVGKISTSFKEVQIENHDNAKDINSNWRGFESFIGLSQFQKGSSVEYFLGQGFGKSAPLGFVMPLGSSTFNSIPKFHNGYITILLKTGFLGIFLFLSFVYRISKPTSKFLIQSSHDFYFTHFLINGLIIFFIFLTFFIF